MTDESEGASATISAAEVPDTSARLSHRIGIVAGLAGIVGIPLLLMMQASSNSERQIQLDGRLNALEGRFDSMQSSIDATKAAAIAASRSIGARGLDRLSANVEIMRANADAQQDIRTLLLGLPDPTGDRKNDAAELDRHFGEYMGSIASALNSYWEWHVRFSTALASATSTLESKEEKLDAELKEIAKTLRPPKSSGGARVLGGAAGDAARAREATMKRELAARETVAIEERARCRTLVEEAAALAVRHATAKAAAETLSPPGTAERAPDSTRTKSEAPVD